MNSDSDDEISNLRAAALSSRPSNMRKRKVTLINSSNVSGDGGSDKRKIILNPRKVVIGANAGSLRQTQENSATASDSDPNWPHAVMDSYTPKKPKLQNDHRTLSMGEKQVKTGKDQRIFTATKEKRNKEFAPDEGIDLDTDVRIILDDDNGDGASMKENDQEKYEVIEIDDEDELEITKDRDQTIDIDDDVPNDEAAEREKISLRKIEITSSDQTTEREEIDEADEEVDEIEGDHGGEDGDGNDDEENDKKEAQNEHLKEKKQESGEKHREVDEVENHVKDVGKGEGGSERKLKDHENVVKHGNSAETTDKKNENKLNKTGKNKPIGKNKFVGKKDENPKKNTADITNVVKVGKKSASDSSDDESSGSYSDSSNSSDSSSSSGSSSSSYSGSSSSSRSSSGSSSGSDSNSDDDDEKSNHSRNSSRRASDSSAYSYSTGGSAEKNTMRSVISHKDKVSRRSQSPRRSPRRSPRGRWSPRDRKYPHSRRSYDRDDNYGRDSYRNERVRSSRDESPKFVRRRSPHSRLGRRASPPRDHRRDRNRSRERERPRDSRHAERRRRRPTRSKSVEEKNHSDKKNLSRTDDDFVEIDVNRKPRIEESKKSRRLGERRVDINVRGSGFDLRSRLGPTKSETNLIITKKIDARENVKPRQVKEKEDEELVEVEDEEEDENYADDEGQNGDDMYERSSFISRKSHVKSLLDDKEAELDAKILRIARMNEEIRRRQEEIEREKMLYS